MPMPDSFVLPFRIEDGWPVEIPGCHVTLRESGIVLGGLYFDDEEWMSLRPGTIYCIRIDDHPATEGWSVHHPDGSVESRELTVPMAPVLVPEDALHTPRAFGDWVAHVHGASGRILVWDSTLTWWWAQEPDLEATLICAPAGRFSPHSDVLSWLSFGTETGRRLIDELCERYRIVV